MKTKKSIALQTAILLLGITALFVSCKKESIQPPPASSGNTTNVYSFPLTNGSYWIYQHDMLDSAGNIIATGCLDSTWVKGDTIIGAYTYKKVRSVNLGGNPYNGITPLRLLRDSAGYLVDDTGWYIEHDNFTDTLHYQSNMGAMDAWYFMRHGDSLVTVNAGTFTIIDYEGNGYPTASNYPYAVPLYTHDMYADNIGLVLKQSAMMWTSQVNRKVLVRYHIQ